MCVGEIDVKTVNYIKPNPTARNRGNDNARARSPVKLLKIRDIIHQKSTKYSRCYLLYYNRVYYYFTSDSFGNLSK